MGEMIRRTKYVLLIDLVLFLVDPGTHDSAPDIAWKWGQLHVIASFGMVCVFVYCAIKQAPSFRAGLIAGAIFWFVWRPALFIASVITGLLSGRVDASALPQTALGVLIALVLFSPVALLLSWLTSLVVRKLAMRA